MSRPNTRRRGYYSKSRDEEYAQDSGPATPEQGPEVDSVIADIAKGFMVAQAKLAAAPASSADPEMFRLLQKISQQLENLDQSRQQSGQSAGQTGTGSGGAGRQNQTGTGQAQNQPSPDAQPDLSSLFSRLLQPDAQNSPSASQSPAKQSAGGASGDPKAVTAQTAAQVLAQAQYELANELEASLNKLKQVISESEKLANKISNLLEKEKNAQ